MKNIESTEIIENGFTTIQNIAREPDLQASKACDYILNVDRTKQVQVESEAS